MLPDPFEMDDAAYLLGALSAPERARYEQHLQTCDTCRRSLTELAGLPGVLRRLPVDVVLSMDAPETAEPDDEASAPASLLPKLLDRVQHEERRRRRVTALRWASGITAGAAAVVVATLAIAGPGGDPAPATRPPTAELELERLVETPLSGNVSVREVAWGTKIQVECDYPAPGGTDPYEDEPEYSLVVHDVDGDSEQVATWNAVAGKELTIDAATAVRWDNIAWMEIRSQDGTAVLGTSR